MTRETRVRFAHVTVGQARSLPFARKPSIFLAYRTVSRPILDSPRHGAIEFADLRIDGLLMENRKSLNVIMYVTNFISSQTTVSAYGRLQKYESGSVGSGVCDSSVPADVLNAL